MGDRSTGICAKEERACHGHCSGVARGGGGGGGGDKIKKVKKISYLRK